MAPSTLCPDTPAARAACESARRVERQRRAFWATVVVVASLAATALTSCCSDSLQPRCEPCQPHPRVQTRAADGTFGDQTASTCPTGYVAK